MKVSTKNILLFLWTLALLCFRPSIFGEKYNLLVCIVFLFLTFLVITTGNYLIRKNQFAVFALIALMAFYFLAQGFILKAPTAIVFNSCFLIVFVSISIAIVTSYNAVQIIKAFILIHVALSLSSIVTIFLYILFGLNPDGLISITDLNDLVGRPHLEYIYAFEGHTLYFPYSVNWASIGVAGHPIPRMLGIYREAGMGQIFFFTAYFMSYLVDFNRTRLIRTMLLLGGILTFSTSGLLSFFAGYILLNHFPQWKFRFSTRKFVIAFIAVPLILFVLIFAPDIGVLDKVASLSGGQRTQSFLHSVKLLSENPVFGTGYYKGFENMDSRGEEYVQFLGIIGVAYQIGFVGIILYFLPWIYAINYFHSKKTVFVLAPCLVTLFFSQPSYNDMIVWFLLLINFKETSQQQHTYFHPL